MFFIPEDVDPVWLWEEVAAVIEPGANRPTVVREKSNKLMLDFTWNKDLLSSVARRDRRTGTTMRAKVYNKSAEQFLSRGAQEFNAGTGFYNYCYLTEKHKIVQVEAHGWTRVEFTFYFHTGQESDDFLAKNVAETYRTKFKEMADNMIFVLGKSNCIRQVSFHDFVCRLFKNAGLANTLFSVWPNKYFPNAVAVYYGYDSSFEKYIGLTALVNNNFKLNQLFKELAMPFKHVYIQEPVSVLEDRFLPHNFSVMRFDGKETKYQVTGMVRE